MAVIGQLGIKPLVQRGNQATPIALIDDLGAVGQLAIAYFELTRLCCAQCRQSGHGIAMDMLRPFEVAVGELPSDHCQVLADQRSLAGIVPLGHDLLDTAVGRLGKDVGGCREGKWHDVRPPLSDLLLPRQQDGPDGGPRAPMSVPVQVPTGMVRKAPKPPRTGEVQLSLAVPARPRPDIRKGLPIGAYSDDQLDEMAAWLMSDGQERTRDELADALRAELGLTRRTHRVDSAVTARLYGMIGITESRCIPGRLQDTCATTFLPACS